MIYSYQPKTEKENLTLSLFDPSGKIKWQNNYPAFVENADDGELHEEHTLIELGAMQSINDVTGLEKHLKNIGVIQENDTVQLKN